MKFEKYETELSTTIAATVDNVLLVADMSVIDKDHANSYIDMCENKNVEKNLKEILSRYKNVYFFNRLNVPNKLRGLGLGKELLQEVINYCDEKDIFLVNTASNSGKMGQSSLIQFYIDSGMELIHNEGLLVYYPGIKKLSKKQLKI